MHWTENIKAPKIRTLAVDVSFIQDKSQSMFQKILLTTDGTLTNLLKLFTGETIHVKKICQEIVLSSEPELLLCNYGSPVLKREILLSGTEKNYVYCNSTFVFERLSRTIQYKLLETDLPIGLMWKEEKLETYKEIVDYHAEPAGNICRYFDITPQTVLLSRTYFIYHQKIPFGAITEKFPVTYFLNE